MTSNRLEAFTDGVLAIVITVMVLELRVPVNGSVAAAREAVPVLLAYVLSFINIGVYWSNHHHLFQATERIDGRILWCNLFLLFWLSLMPFVIRWLDESSFAVLPTAAYGVLLLMASLAWRLTERAIILRNGASSSVSKALGRDRKAVLSIIAYGLAVPLTFADTRVAIGLYVGITAFWLVPDRRIERVMEGKGL
ncbi:MAG: hypothetical protein CMN72_03865 [Sphingomonas sp.]|nr:hypothetical protein [Sphingomonas sp.]